MKKKILVADDDENIVTLISQRLTVNNYNVVTAYDGIETVCMAHKERPDLIILDIKMPAGSGLKVYEQLCISSDTEKIPVIFITGYPAPDVEEAALCLGTPFITKPFDSEKLMGTIEKVLDKSS